jgi:hypothetical protein
MARLVDELQHIRIVARERMRAHRATCRDRRHCLLRQGDCNVAWRWEQADADGCSVRVDARESGDCQCVALAISLTLRVLLMQRGLSAPQLLAACDELACIGWGGSGRTATITVSAATRPEWLPAPALQ